MIRSFIGTKEYMGPELYEGGQYDPLAVDVWALGIMLDEMLFKTSFFHTSNNINKTINNILNKEYKVRDYVSLNEKTKKILTGMLNHHA